MGIKKLLEITKPLFSQELTPGGRMNLGAGLLLIALDIILSINIEIKDIAFIGVRNFPTLGVTIVILVYLIGCVTYLFFRNYKEMK